MRLCVFVCFPSDYDCTRLLNWSRVIDDEICFADKEAFNIYEMLHTRYSMFKRVYTHRVGQVKKKRYTRRECLCVYVDKRRTEREREWRVRESVWRVRESERDREEGERKSDRDREKNKVIERRKVG